LIQANQVNGAFSNVVNGLANALKYSVAYAPDAVTVTVTQGSFQPFSASPAATTVARVLDGIGDDSRAAALIGALNRMPGSELPSALASLAPTQATAMPQVLNANTQASMQGLSQRAAEIRSGSTGLSLSQIQLFDGPIPVDALMADAGSRLPGGARVFQPAPDNRWGFFAAGTGDVGELNPGTGSQNSTFFGGGFQAGADYRISQALTLGLSAGYTHSKTDFNDSSSNTSVDSARFGAYGTWQDATGDWVDGMAGGAHHWFDSNRETVGGLAHGNATGLEFDSSAQYGHDFRPGGGWTLTPTFGMSYVRLMLDGFTESGSLAPLAMEGTDSDSLRSELGGTVAYRFRALGIGWNPYVQAGWNHEFLSPTPAATARLASGAGSLFTVDGETIGRESASFGAGIDAELSERLLVRFGYAGEANSQYQDHQFQAGLRFRF
jgi:outer membrane autotransporter protein